MAQQQIWGTLARAVNDETLIDEAIGEAVAAHNDDPDAHLSEGQSLTTHRAAEIIDHLAESVVNDKIATKARRYIAIVDPSSESDFATIESAVAYAIGKGGGDIYVVRGTHYLSGDISIPPTIGFYGDGIGETIITGNDATLRSLNLYTKTVFASGYAVLTEAAIGASTFTMVPNGTTQGPFQAGQFCRFYATVETFVKILSFDAQTNTITLDGVVPAFTDECEVDVVPGITLTNGTSTATLITNLITMPTTYYAGMSIGDYNTGAEYKTTGYDGDVTFDLALPYTGSTATIPAIISFTGKTTMICNGISFNPDIPTVRFAGSGYHMSILFEACENVNCAVINTDTSNATYLGCVFHTSASSTTQINYIAHFINCLFIATANGSYGIYANGRSIFTGCHFRANGFTNHHWLRGDSKECRITNCIFESQVGETILNNVVSGTDYGLVISGNYFYLEADNTLDFSTQYALVFGNHFYTSGTGGITFTNTAANCIVMGNYCATTLTTTISTVRLYNNITTSYAPYAALGSDVNAMDFAVNESVKRTPNATATYTTTVPPAGAQRTLMILTSGTSSYTITFGTGFKTTATLVTGTVTAKMFVLHFISDGTNLYEVSRTAAYTA